MKKNPLVSVVIPVYNEERYLDYCLASLFEQSYKNIEIIIVDDGSTDQSLEIAKKYKVKVLKQSHQGPGAARNYGAEHAKGEILSFLDADMKYDKRFIEKLIEPILKKDVVGTFHKEEYVANFKNVWSQCWSMNSDLPITNRLPLDLPNEVSVFRAIKKGVFSSVGGYDPNVGYGEDITISKKLQKKAIAAPKALAYHFNPESLSEVYYSSRWIGRGMSSQKNIENFFRYSILNSLRNAVKKINKGAPLQYIIFKIVYDFGMFRGIFLSKKIEK